MTTCTHCGSACEGGERSDDGACPACLESAGRPFCDGCLLLAERLLETERRAEDYRRVIMEGERGGAY